MQWSTIPSGEEIAFSKSWNIPQQRKLQIAGKVGQPLFSIGLNVMIAEAYYWHATITCHGFFIIFYV